MNNFVANKNQKIKQLINQSIRIETITHQFIIDFMYNPIIKPHKIFSSFRIENVEKTKIENTKKAEEIHLINSKLCLKVRVYSVSLLLFIVNI